jgi:hypothetical protein
MTATHPKGNIGVERWIGHSRMSDPGIHAARIAELPAVVGVLNRVVQGLLIHVDWLGAYGVAADQVRAHTRATLPMADRLAEIIDADARPLLVSRLPPRRSAVTCRDFALMTTSFLHCEGVPARLRCGFASYLGTGWEDHWVCEFWHDPTGAWRLCDPQIDEVMSARLAIEFDPANVPRTSFLTAGEAWLGWRAGRSDPRRFGPARRPAYGSCGSTSCATISPSMARRPPPGTIGERRLRQSVSLAAKGWIWPIVSRRDRRSN